MTQRAVSTMDKARAWAQTTAVTQILFHNYFTGLEVEMQDKIEKWYHKINVPQACFILLTLRIVFLGSGFGEAIALIAIAGMYGWHEYINKENKTCM